MFKVVSVFCGCGGLDLGIEKGWERLREREREPLLVEKGLLK
jgi:hypothetical protein